MNIELERPEYLKDQFYLNQKKTNKNKTRTSKPEHKEEFTATKKYHIQKQDKLMSKK